ncbi:MAG TPA: EamA family transporter [Blastocatellia bacterium]|nr:EamA family transporter [Blastocatellia bacterium]
MPLTALILVIAAATMHAGWNLIVKRVGEKQIFTWWALAFGALINLPLLAVNTIPASVWPYALASAVVEAAYFMILIRAYSQGDFSQVYPIARGAAPAFLAVWAMLFLGERPEPAGIIGLILLLAGLIVVGGGRFWSKPRAVALNASAIVAALAVALCISIYSAIDAAAVRIMSPAAYNVLVLGLTALFITPVVMMRYGYRSVIVEGRAEWPRIMAVGVLLLLAYLFVLQAYSMARASYVGALREVSVVIAALAGWRLLGEGFGARRTAGAVLIFSGIIVVAVAG